MASQEKRASVASRQIDDADTFLHFINLKPAGHKLLSSPVPVCEPLRLLREISVNDEEEAAK